MFQCSMLNSVCKVHSVGQVPSHSTELFLNCSW